MSQKNQKMSNKSKNEAFFSKKNNSKHNMKTRYPEIFHTQFAHTERLKKSPIIFMQKLLNDEAMNK